ncbi:DUF1642 domain-containing protein [Lactococcus lactis subsp. lactis]|uniref:DUF1642 domain-containing protein n=1 Tax=Lactococcus lactis TaxID=1358 RepID=UPI003749FD2A
MTKFEEDLNEKLNSEKVPMYITQNRCSMTRTTYIETSWIFDNYKNWHSDEEFKAEIKKLTDQLITRNDELISSNYEIESLKSQLISREKQVIELKEADKAQGKEIIQLKSQLQQQALPVVPEFVAEFVSGDKTELSKADRIAYLLKSVEGDNYYLEEYLTNSGIISQEQSEHLYAWATNQTHETILELWNGYTVEKPKLFYLKNILTGQFLAKYNDFKDVYFFWHGLDPLTNDIGTAYKLKFTQQEIDDLDTGGYEQKEVEE